MAVKQRRSLAPGFKTKTSPKTSPRSRARASRSRADGAIRILIADDLAMDRSGLVSILGTQADFSVVGEASSISEVLALCRKLRPSVLVVALRLETTDGGSAVSVIHRASPATPILAVAERGAGKCLVLNPPGSRTRASGPEPPCATGTDCLQMAVLDGASGTIRRDSMPADLYHAIRTVAAGRPWYEAGTAASIIRHALAVNQREPDSALSSRELEVAELIANGRSNKEISAALGISEPTVKKHVGHILAKLQLQDRLQIGLYVARNPLMLRALETRRS